jgi:predicted RNA-binding Zn ribbon-like protein
VEVELGHDTQHALATFVDLVNTGPDASGEEGLPDPFALRRFVEQWELSEVGELTDGDLASVHRLRDRFREVFLAGTQPQAAELVNAIVSDARTTPRLTDHDGYDWHVHYFAPGATLAEHLAADCGMALAFVLAAGERERLRVCEAPNCERVLVDLSRNRSRRYCDSRTCGNRLHVAAYRERRRAAAG